MTARRPLRTGAELRRLFDPGSVCVVGVSEKPGNFGVMTLENLRGFDGTLSAVHPRLTEVAGVPCVPSLRDLPEPPDCVVICTPAATIPDLLEEAAEIGAGGAVVYASGFAETGEAGAALQARIAEIAGRTGLRVLGPNCLGFINHVRRTGVTFAPAYLEVPHLVGPVGVVSQSGAMRDIFQQAPRRGMGLSHMLAAGNSADMDVWDLVAFLIDDPDTKAVACIFEGVQDGARLAEVGARARVAGKTVVACNIATGESSKRVAQSHTGAMASADAVVAAALQAAGIVQVHDIEDLCPTAAFFAKAPARPSGQGSFVISTSGGACVLAAAKAEAAGVALPAPKPDTEARLRAVLPDFVPAQNPCDATAMVLARRESFMECMQAFLDDPDYAAGLIAFPAYSVGGTESRVEFIGEVAAANPERMMCVVWMVEWPEAPPALMAEKHPNLALFRSMRQCMAALRAWQDRAEIPAEAPRLTAEDRTPASGPLDEAKAKALLAARGIGVTREAVVADAEAAVQAAAGMGGPVAMKVSSSAIQHKTEIGGVRLNLSDPGEIREAFEALKAATLEAAPHAPFEGVLVQEMLPPGVELILGGFDDPVFGPVVTVGAGGVFAEAMRDAQLALAPVTVAQARAMLDRLRARPLLDGWRGGPAADIDAVAEAVARASELLADGAGWLAELDINPLIAGPGGAKAADALIVPKAEETAT